VVTKRAIPAFAPESFQSWYKKRNHQRNKQKTVILWPDTFNNHFHPETAKAALRVLERAGYFVKVPNQFLCCARPLLEYGMISLAKKQLHTILDTLSPDIENGIYLICLEPSCTSVFRDELKELFPEDKIAKKLSQQTFTLAEFIDSHPKDFHLSESDGSVLMHTHCHQKAIMGSDADQRVLKKMGFELHQLDSGCCGMAGSFGFEKEKYEVSVKVGEQRLLPKVRSAERSTIIQSDGFSCRTLIQQDTNRQAMHLAQIIDLAQDNGRSIVGPADYPEIFSQQSSAQPHLALAVTVGVIAIGALIGWLKAVNQYQPSRP